MRRSHTITLQIDYPFEDAYRFLADPLNYGTWAAVDQASYRPLGNGDWEGMTAFGGKRHFRFTPANGFGVLDHAVFIPAEKPLWTPMRVMPNAGGTELAFTFYQRPGMSDEEFASAVEWITTDFLTLKSLLEALRR
jgi:hypothetical protein